MEDLTVRMREKEPLNRFAVHNYIELVAVKPDYAEFRLNIQPESKNAYGFVHGGALSTLADNAAGFAVHTDGRSYVTQNCVLHFFRNQTEGVITATAQVRHRGKSTVLATVDLIGEDNKLLATGEFTYFCVDRSIMNQKGKK